MQSLPQLRIPLFFLFLGAVFFTSCIPNKKLVYFPDPDFNENTLTTSNIPPTDYLLQPGDILSVRVKTLDEISSEYFNIEPQNNNFNLNPASLYLNGYSLDADGNINFPEIGKLKVGGLTLEQTRNKIQDSVGMYLNNSTVLVKLVSFKITVLGEVQKPGHYFVYNEQASILEGLGMAGDLTDFGNRENITLIRKTSDGTATILIDMKDPNLLSSSFFYLQPNDVLYVQPLKAKNSRDNLSTLTLLGVLFGAISATVLLLDFVK